MGGDAPKIPSEEWLKDPNLPPSESVGGSTSVFQFFMNRLGIGRRSENLNELKTYHPRIACEAGADDRPLHFTGEFHVGALGTPDEMTIRATGTQEPDGRITGEKTLTFYDGTPSQVVRTGDPNSPASQRLEYELQQYAKECPKPPKPSGP
jgi:hypothetical protein